MTAPRHHIHLTLPRAQFTLQVTLDLPGQGITVIFGASGSGKTSLLRCVAGLERAGSGRIQLGHTTWQDDALGIFVPTWQRALGYVFQEPSLFDHLTVQGNLTYGLKRLGARATSHSLNEAIDLLGIRALLPRRPQTLSGGERQRVAIARALATQPQWLLLDEPLAALDQARRHDILPWLERLRDHSQIPMLYVTHSVDELHRLADRVVVLEHGRVVTVGSLAEVAHQGLIPSPALGPGLDTDGIIVQRHLATGLVTVQTPHGQLQMADPGLAEGSTIRLRAQLHAPKPT